MTNLAHFLPGHRRAAVIGVGGGRDMLSARVFGVPEITGVEINPILARLLTTEPGFADFSGIANQPGFHFHVDEGRSWFARTSRVRCHPDESGRYLGGDRRRRFYLERERTLHRRCMDDFSGPSPTTAFLPSAVGIRPDANETSRLVSPGCCDIVQTWVTEPRRHVPLPHPAASRHTVMCVRRSATPIWRYLIRSRRQAIQDPAVPRWRSDNIDARRIIGSGSWSCVD